MRIIIVGAGAVGSYLAARLSQDGQDVVVIEDDATIGADLQESIDALVIQGNGASSTTLEEAGAGRSDLLIAVTSSDGANVLACHAAKGLGTKMTIARIEHPEIREGSEQLGVDVVIDPSETAAEEIVDIVGLGGASELIQFADGKLVMVGGNVGAGAPITGVPLRELRLRSAEWGWVLAALVREGRTIVAHGDTEVAAGDHALVMTTDDNAERAARLIGLKRHEFSRAIIFGGTRLAELTADKMAEAGLEVVLIDEDNSRCRSLADKHPRALVMCGDPTDPDLAASLELGSDDVAMALTGWDEVNLLACLVAKASGAGMTISRFHRIAYVGLLAGIGIDAAASTRLMAANAILQFVRFGEIERVVTFSDTDAEAIELEVAESAQAVDRTLLDLKLPVGVIIGGISRGGTTFVPDGSTVIRAGDHLIFFSLPRDIQESTALFGMKDERIRKSPVAKLLNTVAYVIGSVLVFVAVAMMTASLLSVLNGEFANALQISVAGITVLVGYVTRRVVPRPKTLTVKESFATVGLSWFVISIFGALPYLLTGEIPSPIDAVFESTSGFTTTGFTVVLDPSSLPVGIAFWRGLTQWLGGMGVIVLGVIVLPFLGTGGAQLAQAEGSGHTVERLAPRFRETAKRLLGVYIGITAIEFIFLWAGEMDWLQALIHSFATIATGGFGTEANSVAGFNPYTQWVITFFMVLAGVSFVLHFRALTRPTQYLRNSEFKLYITILAVASIIVIGGLAREFESAEAIRLGAFNAISVATGTGFTTADIGLWRPTLQITLIGLMFLGGMAGSTSGAIKTFRVGVLAKAAFADVRRIVRPRGVFGTRFGGKTIPPEIVEAVQSFFLFYMLIFMTSTFLLAFIDANISEGLDLVTATSAVASSMGNVGAGLGLIGPAGSFQPIPGLGKVLLSGLMILGRLELFPVLVLFTKDLWRR